MKKILLMISFLIPINFKGLEVIFEETEKTRQIIVYDYSQEVDTTIEVVESEKEQSEQYEIKTKEPVVYWFPPFY